MKATFELTEIIQSWAGGGKKTENKAFAVKEGESFDVHPKTLEPLFTLLKLTPEKALLKYHREFTLKGYEHPQSRETLIERGQAKEFSHLWGANGLTKKLTYNGINSE